MGLFAWIKSLFLRRKVEREIAENSYPTHTSQANNLPLEPEKDPWRS